MAGFFAIVLCVVKYWGLFAWKFKKCICDSDISCNIAVERQQKAFGVYYLITNKYHKSISKTSDAVNAELALDAALLQRNQLLYADGAGLVDVAATAKTYIKSVFGPSSDQFKLVSKLEFRSYN